MLRIFTYLVFFTLVQCPLSIVCPVLTCVPLTSSTNSGVLPCLPLSGCCPTWSSNGFCCCCSDLFWFKNFALLTLLQSFIYSCFYFFWNNSCYHLQPRVLHLGPTSTPTMTEGLHHKWTRQTARRMMLCNPSRAEARVLSHPPPAKPRVDQPTPNLSEGTWSGPRSSHQTFGSSRSRQRKRSWPPLTFDLPGRPTGEVERHTVVAPQREREAWPTPASGSLTLTSYPWRVMLFTPRS